MLAKLTKSPVHLAGESQVDAGISEFGQADLLEERLVAQCGDHLTRAFVYSVESFLLYASVVELGCHVAFGDEEQTLIEGTC